MLGGGLQFIVVFMIVYFWQRRNQNWHSIFIFPLSMSLIEWLISLTSVGTYQTIAYNQLHFLPVAQIAALGGYIAITFVLSLFAATISYVIVQYKNKNQAIKALIVGIIIIAIVLIFGMFRLQKTSPQGHVKIGMVNITLPITDALNANNAETIIKYYEPSFNSLVSQGAKIIMIPEESMLATSRTQARLKQIIADYAKQHKIYLIVGVRLKLTKTYNVAWLFNPKGKLFAEYIKRHLVPNVEDKIITPKKTLTEFNYQAYKFAIAICRDMDYPKPAETYGKDDVNLLFVPAWDFKVDAWSHGRLAYMRGIEYGYTMVRAARDGYLSVSTKTGKFVAHKYTAERMPVSLLVNTPIAQGGSFYASHRYWFLGMLIFLLAVLLIIQIYKEIRS